MPDVLILMPFDMVLDDAVLCVLCWIVCSTLRMSAFAAPEVIRFDFFSNVYRAPLLSQHTSCFHWI